ncbi:MAG: 16S rRNA (guanine(527)-N(7))-methyltransferase RsmG [Clostridiaceae bacterium]|nr:16S rRNA (guanine(527)-N(7))-methyltransferase RsmG [Eubacteriales bacterium]
MSEIFDAVRAALPSLDEARQRKLCVFYEMLVDWNARMNLTAITDPAEVASKHFADSVLPESLLKKNARVIDVGTGAGFPGIPLAVARPDLSFTLMDALQKRVGFLEAACKELNLNIQCVHARAEEAGKSLSYRAGFDAALSRAVAPASVLTELTVPFLKEGGVSLMYKGPQAESELLSAKNALHLLRAEAELVKFDAAWGERRVIFVTKLAPTPENYPRASGVMKKKPL